MSPHTSPPSPETGNSAGDKPDRVAEIAQALKDLTPEERRALAIALLQAK
ncbi:MAG: hypothetical protein IT368_17885 [Candidatus Hydrogenedentes bacterium]|nr:hypothetical protein [Candidatus Hydrogenedentota bacterium]